MKGRGQKATVRIWPEARAALRSLREQFSPGSRYGLNEQLISSAILLLAEESTSGLVRSKGRWRPMSPAEAQARDLVYGQSQPRESAPKPVLHLV